MSELFKEMSMKDFKKLLVSRGLTNVQIGDSLRVVDEINVLSNGMKPVYLVSINSDDGTAISKETAEYLYSMFLYTNIADILIPRGEINIEGAIVEEGSQNE